MAVKQAQREHEKLAKEEDQSNETITSTQTQLQRAQGRITLPTL
jgi:hypothetical protein